jgi:hypothetical protein
MTSLLTPCTLLSHRRRLCEVGAKAPNPAVDPVRFALWTLRDEAAQRRSP